MGRRTVASILFAVLALVALPACGAAQQSRDRDNGGVVLKKVGSFDEPTYVAGAPGFPKLLFVVEQPGRVAVMRSGRELSHPFLDISGLVGDGGERGLLSVAFPPDYPQTRRFYVYYTDNQGNIRIDEFLRRSATRAAAGSRRP